jgi:hypothetical protein
MAWSSPVSSWNRLVKANPARVCRDARLYFNLTSTWLSWLFVGTILYAGFYVLPKGALSASDVARLTLWFQIFTVASVPLLIALPRWAPRLSYWLTVRTITPPSVPFPPPHPRKWEVFARREGRSSVFALFAAAFITCIYILSLFLSFGPSGPAPSTSPSSGWSIPALLQLIFLASPLLLSGFLCLGVFRAFRSEYMRVLENAGPTALAKTARIREQFDRVTDVVYEASKLSDELESLIASQQGRLSDLLSTYQRDQHISALTHDQAEAVGRRLSAGNEKTARRERTINIIVAIIGTTVGYILSELAPFAYLLRRR